MQIVEQKERMTQSHQSLAQVNLVVSVPVVPPSYDRIHVEYYGVETPLNQSLQLLIQKRVFCW